MVMSGCICLEKGLTHHPDNTCQGHDSHISPPLLTPDISCSASESVCLSSQSVRLVHQKIQALSSLQDRVDVLNHDILANRRVSMLWLVTLSVWDSHIV